MTHKWPTNSVPSSLPFLSLFLPISLIPCCQATAGRSHGKTLTNTQSILSTYFMMAQRNRRDLSGPHTPKKCDWGFYIHYTSVQRVWWLHSYSIWFLEMGRDEGMVWRETHNSKPQHKKQNEIKVNYINRSSKEFKLSHMIRHKTWHANLKLTTNTKTVKDLWKMQILSEKWSASLCSYVRLVWQRIVETSNRFHPFSGFIKKKSLIIKKHKYHCYRINFCFQKVPFFLQLPVHISPEHEFPTTIRPTYISSPPWISRDQ